jgi:hypothetical protein
MRAHARPAGDGGDHIYLGAVGEGLLEPSAVANVDLADEHVDMAALPAGLVADPSFDGRQILRQSIEQGGHRRRVRQLDNHRALTADVLAKRGR